MKNNDLKTFAATKTARVTATFLLITLLIPIASPIPLWASNLNLPKSVDDGFRLTAPTPLISNSTLGFVSDLAGNLGLINGVGKSEDSNEIEKANVTSKAVLLAKVKKISTQISEEKVVKVGEDILLNAIPLDEKGNAVQGLVFNWESANQDILRIKPDGKAIALIEGETVLTAKLGKFKKDFLIKVSNIKAAEASITNSSAVSIVVNQLPDNEIESKYSSVNNVGNPPGKTEMESPQEAAALGIRHRVGISNFSFGLPLASLSGRGLNAGIGMSYNSRAWNKSATPIADPPYSQPHFTYDVEESWIAPGFSSGFGYLETQNRLFSTHPTTNTGVFTNYTEIVPVGLVDSDGTRHQFGCASWTQISGTYESECNKYAAQDGTFITILGNKKKYNLNNSTQIDQSYTSTFIVNYPNGSKIYYGDSYGSVSGFTKKQYAYSIQERNGNRISINYLAGGKGKIDFILDTMNRYIRFYYDTTAEQKLVTITVPAYGETIAERQVVRFYYAEIPLDYVGKYTGTTTAPATIKVLNRVYYPATNMGYKYDYHPNFGMITKIQRFHGMVPSGNSTTETGTITNDGNWAATTEYNYPVSSTPIDDVPKYNERTDDWYGRDTSNPAPKVLYHSPTENPPQYGTPRLSSRIETANGTYSSNIINETYSNYESNWKDGLVHETIIKDGNGQFGEIKSKTKYFWEATLVPFGGYVPFLRKIEVTNDAGQTKATRFEYDEYNNQKAVDEHDFAASGSLGTLLKRTETTYQTGAGWLDRNLISLPTSVVTKVDNIPVSKTLIEYDHNGDDSTLVRRNDISISTHDTFYNPAHPVQCQMICAGDTEPCSYNTNTQNPVPPNGCVFQYTYGYKAASAFRGNVTKVTTFSDATLTTDSNAAVSNTEYDIAGNAVEASASCCKIKAWNYDKANEYAFVVSEEQGDAGQLVTSSTYDRNTGLMKTATDENNQTTTVTYDPTSLRQTRVDKPNDAWSTVEYHDQSYPFYVKSTSSLDTSRNVSSWSFSDGRGAGYRTRSQTLGGYLSSDVGFDKNGSPIKNYSPYTVSDLNGARPSGTKFSEIKERDALGRVLSTQLTDDTIVSATYNGTVATATDQAGKTRRQVADALGRTIRVDEPNAAGLLGDVASPIQPTFYEYDGNDNLSKVTQSDGTNTQERLFKYDSLSRLTHEKQVEATASLNNAGEKIGSGGLWTGVYKYDNESLLTEGVDARGVKTSFVYDGLNRVSAVNYSGETGYATPNVSYTYDEIRVNSFNKGRLTKVQTAANIAQQTPETKQIYDYDNVGQVVNHTQTIGNQSYNLTYGYNLAGQLTTEKYPSGKVFNYSVDDFGRLQTVADNQRQYLSSVSFNNKGLLESLNLGNGTSESFGYNDRFQMTNQSLNKGSQVLQKYDYGYGQIDASGNLDLTKNNGQLAKIESFIGTQKQSTQKFSYDSIGRLSEAKEFKGTDNSLTYKQKFDFDRFGNMYRKAANNGTAGQISALPYTTIEDADISKATNRFTTNTTYNEAGMVIADNKFRSMNFSYDANGRQVNATNATNSTNATTVYDALGNRVATKVNDVWQFVIYDAFGKLVAEYGTQGEGNGGVSYVLQDWQGSVRASVNNNGFIQARFDFTAFGEEISLGIGTRLIENGYSGDATSRNGYGLTEKDSSGLNHTWFRKQEQRAGRWTSPDPYKGSMNLGNPQSFNRYSYVENDAVNLVDPSGLQLRYYDVPRGLGCVVWGDGTTHCTQYIDRYWYDDGIGGGVGGSNTGDDYGGLGGSGLPAEDDKRGPCERMADRAQEIADKLRRKGRISAREILTAFNNEFTSRYIGQSVDGWRAAGTLAVNGGGTGSADPQELGQSDFLAKFWEGTNAGLDQVHHFAAYFSAGITGGSSGYISTSVHLANDDNEGDKELGRAAYALGSALRGGEQNITSTFEKLENIGRDIKNSICNLKK